LAGIFNSQALQGEIKDFFARQEGTYFDSASDHVNETDHLLLIGSCFRQLLQYLAVALPLLATRTAYSLLQIFYLDTDYQPWNPIYGSAISFGVMALFPEFIVLVMYLIVGWYLCPGCTSGSPSTSRHEETKVEATA